MGVEEFDAGVGYDQAEEITPFALLPIGPRTVQIEEVNEGARSQAGNRTFSYKAKILNPPAGQPAPGPTGEPMKWPTYVFIRMNSSPKTADFWKTLYKACGTKWVGMKINPNGLVGKKLIVDITHREYPKGSGRMQNDIAAGGFHPAKVA